MGRRYRAHQIIGVLLMIAGALLVLEYFHLLQGDFFLFYLSGGFLLVYVLLGRTANSGNIGFLIPGCLLLAVAAFAELDDRKLLGEHDGGLFFIFVGIAFLAIFLHTRRFQREDGKPQSWPLIPGVCLLLFGGVVYVLEIAEVSLDTLNDDLVGAVILIGSGLFIFIKGNRKRRSVNIENTGQKGD